MELLALKVPSLSPYKTRLKSEAGAPGGVVVEKCGTSGLTRRMFTNMEQWNDPPYRIVVEG